MTTGLRRYEFSERLAEILGESRRDVRFRVTLMVSGGLVPPGPRGPGSPLATPDYAATLLIGVMAAPQQAHHVEAVRCYRDLQPAAVALNEGVSGLILGRPATRLSVGESAELPLLPGQPRFGAALAHLLDQARDERTRADLTQGLLGVWISRGFPAAALQLALWWEGRRAVVTQRYALPDGGLPPAWLDPARDGVADPGLLHGVFLPVRKLVEIGALTSPHTERTPKMLDLGQTIANLADLARERRNRRPWEKFLSKAAQAQAFSEKIEGKTSRLTEVASFGSNPGNLRMFAYVPDDLPASPALVVVLHGCTQSAASYDNGTGWTTMADRYGFAVLLPEQRRSNNPMRCFNWFKAEDNARDGGEALSIREMVERMALDHGIDRGRIFVTGLSAGAAMTSTMLATYPDVFAGGAIIAGVPYRAANGLQEAFDCIFQGRVLPSQDWGDRVRAASGHEGPWPTVSIWHGEADGTVKPVNAAEIVKQWADVHGLSPSPTHEKTIGGHRHSVWINADGRQAVESYTIAGMAHGAPIDPNGEDGCGNAGPFIHDVGFSSTHHIARFWGLTEHRRAVATAPRPAAAPLTAAPLNGERPTAERPAAPAAPTSTKTIEITPPPPASSTINITPPPPSPPRDVTPVMFRVAGEESARSSAEPGSEQPARDRGADRAGASPLLGINVASIVAKSLQAAGVLRGDSGALAAAERAGSVPLGIDIPSIISTSLEAAGVLRGDRERAAGVRSEGGTMRGIDLQTILSKSFEAAGLMRGSHDSPLPATPRAAATKTPHVDGQGLGGTGWDGNGWQLVGRGEHASNGGHGPELFGYASSGIGCDVGNKVRGVSSQLTLGDRPRLTYDRKLDLGAAINMMTTASFTVLVDGIPVDEVTTTGMDYAEADWIERKGIDLSRFAGRTVTLTFEVAANSNVCMEVSAKAWVRGIRVREAATTRPM
jgi:poly(hydroxyalkanoate) depolymerase family esterase